MGQYHKDFGLVSIIFVINREMLNSTRFFFFFLSKHQLVQLCNTFFKNKYSIYGWNLNMDFKSYLKVFETNTLNKYQFFLQHQSSNFKEWEQRILVKIFYFIFGQFPSLYIAEKLVFSLIWEKMGFCPFFLKYPAKCPMSKTNQGNALILKLDFLKIEFQMHNLIFGTSSYNKRELRYFFFFGNSSSM